MIIILFIIKKEEWKEKKHLKRKCLVLRENNLLLKEYQNSWKRVIYVDIKYKKENLILLNYT